MTMQAESISAGQEQGTAKTSCCAPSAARHAGQIVREVVEEASQKARHAVDVVEGKVEAAERRAKAAAERGRRAVGACETAFEDKVRSSPLKSLLIAAAVGVAAGMTAGALLHRRYTN